MEASRRRFNKKTKLFAPPNPKNNRKWALEAPGFLFERLPFKLKAEAQNYDPLEELAPGT